jgi:hypothetical protein
MSLFYAVYASHGGRKVSRTQHVGVFAVSREVMS